MKKLMFLISIAYCFFMNWQKSDAQITATTTTTYTSVNPKVNVGTTDAQVQQLNLASIASFAQQNVTGGVISNASGGRVDLKVWYYRSDKADGKAALLYWCYSDVNSTTYIEKVGKTYTKSDWIWWPIYWGVTAQWKSTDIITMATQAGLIEAKDNGSGTFSERQIMTNVPVIIEVTITNATLSQFKIPGIGELDAKAFFIGIDTKGSNYEVNPLMANQPFGHANNRFTILNPVRQLSGYQLTGLYDGNMPSPSPSYFKVKVPSIGKLWVAYKQGLSLPSSPFGTNTKLISSAFKIKDKNSAETTFDVYEVTPTAGAAATIAFEATTDGPFIIASKFDVGFKQNTGIPIAKRKLYNRGDNLNAVLICAHRGIWSKLGSHDYTNNQGTAYNPDFSGIAENTLPAYREALYGSFYNDIDWMEFDARRTKDGVFVSWHDDHVRRVSNFADSRACVPIDEVNKRNKLGYDALAAQDPVGTANSKWNYDNAKVSSLNWSTNTTNGTGGTFPAMNSLNVRDYLGCEVKYNAAAGDVAGGSVLARPLQLSESFDWLKIQESSQKYSIISIDYKAGLNDLDDLYKLVLQKGLEGQIIITVYAADYSLAAYKAEYGNDFLKQIAITPNFYEPNGTSNYKNMTDSNGNTITDKALQLKTRFLEYMNAEQEGYFFPGVIYNTNYAGDPYLIDFSKTDDFAIRMTGKTISGATPSGCQYLPKWYMSHYHEPFMSSIVDNNKITTPADCNPSQHLVSEICVDRFWRADFDWQLNNGTNAFFSDSVELLLTYLKAKGKK